MLSGCLADTAWTRTPGATASTSATCLRRILDEVGLVQDDNRRGATLPRHDEVALDPPRVEIAVEAADQKHDVDVGGDDLFLRGVAGGATREAAEARQHGMDARVAVSDGLDDHPVADGGKIRAGFGAMAKTSRHAREQFAFGRADAIDVRVLEHDAAWHAAFTGVFREAAAKVSFQPVLVQGMGHRCGKSYCAERQPGVHCSR